MKKASTFLMGIVLALSLIIAPVVDAREKPLTFSWEQAITPDFAGWHLYARQYDSGGGVLANYTRIATINYDGIDTIIFESEQQVESVDDMEVMFFFVVTAFDVDGNESVASNEVSDLIDFLAPEMPLEFKIKVM